MKKVIISILFFAVGLGLSADDWQQWRGPNRDGISRETGLLQAWPSAGPERVWLSRDIGIGYSAPVVARGRLFVLGTKDGKEQLFAKEAKGGKTLWTAPMGGILSNNWGDGPRGAATVDGDKVYALGAKGGLICVNVGDGKVNWRVEMVKDLGGKVPGWGYTESVLVDGDHVICTPGGKRGTLAAIDKKNGQGYLAQRRLDRWGAICLGGAGRIQRPAAVHPAYAENPDQCFRSRWVGLVA